MENNYSVYQHVTPDGDYYFGATNDIKRRWRNNGAEYKGTSLYPYIEKFGWDNIKHIILFKDQTRENALWIEDFLIISGWEKGNCINKRRSGNIKKEDWYIKKLYKNYYNKNKDNIKEQSKQYYEQNKDKIKQYREQNKDKIKEQSKQYYETNKDKIKEQSKQYREQNKDKIREYQRDYREQNKDKIKQYYEQNKDKIREYKRQYRKRKKLEKQLKEAVETTLF